MHQSTPAKSSSLWTKQESIFCIPNAHNTAFINTLYHLLAHNYWEPSSHKYDMVVKQSASISYIIRLSLVGLALQRRQDPTSRATLYVAGLGGGDPGSSWRASSAREVSWCLKLQPIRTCFLLHRNLSILSWLVYLAHNTIPT
jgi:hypothetical protein